MVSTRRCVLLSAIVAPAILSCGRHDRSERKAEQGDGFRAALLTPGPVSDQSWNAGAYAGLLRIRDSLAAQVSHIQTRTPAEFEENFRQYAAQGFALVIGHGFEYQDAAVRLAPAFPKTIFVVTSSTIAGPNFAGMRFAFEEPAYLAGMVAGAITRTHTIGQIGGTELPPVRDGCVAFEAGVRSVNPRARVVVAYVGNWDDVSAGKEQALAQIVQGADVIFQNADAAGLEVFQAAREARRALVFGSNADQNSVAPDVTIGSVVIDLPHAFLTVARAVNEGHFTPAVLSLGAATNVVRLSLKPPLAGRIPDSLRMRVDSLWQAIIRGEFRVPVGDSTTGRRP